MSQVTSNKLKLVQNSRHPFLTGTCKYEVFTSRSQSKPMFRAKNMFFVKLWFDKYIMIWNMSVTSPLKQTQTCTKLWTYFFLLRCVDWASEVPYIFPFIFWLKNWYLVWLVPCDWLLGCLQRCSLTFWLPLQWCPRFQACHHFHNCSPSGPQLHIRHNSNGLWVSNLLEEEKC